MEYTTSVEVVNVDPTLTLDAYPPSPSAWQGRSSAAACNDGTAPDPCPSPDVNPIATAATAARAYAAAGTYVATATVRDDDAGTLIETVSVGVG